MIFYFPKKMRYALKIWNFHKIILSLSQKKFIRPSYTTEQRIIFFFILKRRK